MNNRRISPGACGVAFLAVWLLTTVPRASYGQASPLFGTWKLNGAKSTYSPGPPPKGTTLTYEAAGEGLKATSQGVDAEGKTTGVQFTANFDGKDYPVTGAQDWDTVALKRVDASTLEQTRKKGGKVVQTATVVVSKDGKGLTVRVTGTNAKGQRVNNVGVYEQQ
jgi:hypothetical protein